MIGLLSRPPFALPSESTTVKALLGAALMSFALLIYDDTFFVTSQPQNKFIFCFGMTSLILGILTWTGVLRKLDRVVCCLFACSLLITMIHYATTHKFQYVTDAGGHFSYIGTLLTQLRLPDPRGWQSQQPPLYYFVGAIFYKAGYAFGMEDPTYATRFLSLLLYIGFLILSLWTLDSVVTRYSPRERGIEFGRRRGMMQYFWHSVWQCPASA